MKLIIVLAAVALLVVPSAAAPSGKKKASAQAIEQIKSLEADMTRHQRWEHMIGELKEAALEAKMLEEEDEGECDDVCFSYTGMTLLSTGPKTDACIDCRKAACTKPEAGFQCSVCPKTNY